VDLHDLPPPAASQDTALANLNPGTPSANFEIF
jgi:hypothetical protein